MKFKQTHKSGGVVVELGPKESPFPVLPDDSKTPSPVFRLKHILVPVWLLSYLYGTRMFQVVVNGYSGQMAGQYPKSPWKMAFLVLLAIIAFFIFIMLSQNN